MSNLHPPQVRSMAKTATSLLNHLSAINCLVCPLDYPSVAQFNTSVFPPA